MNTFEVMAYSSVDVASYFIERAKEADVRDLSPMKLQKLLYFAHGWHLAVNDAPLLTDRIQAWQFGPVIDTLYHETKHYGNDHIDDALTAMWREIDEETIEFLDSIWNTYSPYSAVKLSNATHIEGSPWDQVVKKNGGVIKKNMIIDDQVIKNYFARKINSAG